MTDEATHYCLKHKRLCPPHEERDWLQPGLSREKAHRMRLYRKGPRGKEHWNWKGGRRRVVIYVLPGTYQRLLDDFARRILAGYPRKNLSAIAREVLEREYPPS